MNHLLLQAKNEKCLNRDNGLIYIVECWISNLHSHLGSFASKSSWIFYHLIHFIHRIITKSVVLMHYCIIKRWITMKKKEREGKGEKQPLHRCRDDAGRWLLIAQHLIPISHCHCILYCNRKKETKQIKNKFKYYAAIYYANNWALNTGIIGHCARLNIQYVYIAHIHHIKEEKEIEEGKKNKHTKRNVRKR